MIEEGETAPGFTAPLANGDIEQFDLSEEVTDGPVVLAFFPGAFTSVCTDEIVEDYDLTMDFASLGVYDVVKRAVVVVDEDREVTYAWKSDDPGREPDYSEVERAAAEA